MSVRETTFTLRLEGALRRIVAGRSLRVAAMATGVKISDVRLWLETFNGGSETLTEARILEVKREVGAISERKAEASDGLPTKHTEPEKPEPAAPVDSARNVVAVGGNRGGKSAAAAAAAAAAVVAASETAGVPVAGAVRPWHTKNRKASVKACTKWRPVLDLFLRRNTVISNREIANVVKGIGMKPADWWAFRMAYFGPIEACNAVSVAEFVAAFGVKASKPEVLPQSAQSSDTERTELRHRAHRAGVGEGASHVWSAGGFSSEVRGGGVAVHVLTEPPRPYPPIPVTVSTASFEELLSEIGLLLESYQRARDRGLPAVRIRRGLAEALVEAAALAGKEGV